jgi:ribosomal protein S18 acetylase RimI-like enzyme
MLKDLLIRKFREDDLSSLRNLMLEAENFGKPFLDSELLSLKRDNIPEFGCVYVALLGDTVVGYITLRKNIFAIAIDSIVVKKENQRKGVGTALIKQAKTYAISEGFKILRTDAGNFMDYAIKFYLACGFKPCGYVEHDWGLDTRQLHFYMDLSGKQSRT